MMTAPSLTAATAAGAITLPARERAPHQDAVSIRCGAGYRPAQFPDTGGRAAPGLPEDAHVAALRARALADALRLRALARAARSDGLPKAALRAGNAVAAARSVLRHAQRLSAPYRRAIDRLRPAQGHARIAASVAVSAQPASRPL